LPSIALPAGVTNIYGNAFLNCSSLTNVVLPAALQVIGGQAFEGCSSLANFTIPDTVTDIGGYAFYLSALANVFIPASVTNIALHAFMFVPGPIQVDSLNPNYASADGVLFDKSLATLIQCPSSRTGAYTVPGTVTVIGDSSFFQCAGLTSIRFPNSVTTIADGAFYYCTGLTNAFFGTGVASIGVSSFLYCTTLTGAYFAGNAPAVTNYTFNGDPLAVAYYLPTAQGWGPYLGAIPTATWRPNLSAGDPDFGIRGNGFGFNISWADGMTVVVEACTSLTAPIWTPVSTNTVAGGISSFHDPHWSDFPRRFYRVRWP
jgi:hypothetical protein